MKVTATAALILAVLWSSTARAELPPIDWTEEARAETQATKLRVKTALSLSALGVAIGCAVVGGVLGGQTLKIRSDLEQTSPTDIQTRQTLIDQGEQTRLFTNIAWGVAGGVTVVGGIVWVF